MAIKGLISSDDRFERSPQASHYSHYFSGAKMYIPTMGISQAREELKPSVRVAGLEKLDKDLLEGPMASKKVAKLEKWIDDMEFMLLMCYSC